MIIIPKEYSEQRLIWLFMNSIFWFIISIYALKQVRWAIAYSVNNARDFCAVTLPIIVSIIALIWLVIGIGIIYMRFSSQVKMIPDAVPYFIILGVEVFIVILFAMVLDGWPGIQSLTTEAIIFVNLCLLALPIKKKSKF